MMIFWSLAAVMALGVSAILLLPMLRTHRVSASRAEYDINVYKDQLLELERAAADGAIKDAELDAARIEIQRRLLAAGEEAGQRAVTQAKSGRLVLIVAACAVPVLAVLMYIETGSPGVPDFPLAGRADIADVSGAGTPERHVGEQQAAPMADLIVSLQERLRQDPGNVDGWILLARSYASVGDMRKAAATYERVVKLADRHPALLADWAEARLMARDGEFTQEIYDDLLEAREKDPTQPKPWFYLGLDKALNDDFRGAAQLWTDLLAISPKDASYAQAVHQQLERAAKDGSFDLSEITPSATALAIAGSAPPAPSATVPGPSQDDVNAAQQMSPDDRQAFIRSMVQRLADRLAENPDDAAGWERLIGAYEVLGETAKAAEARKRLEALRGN